MPRKKRSFQHIGSLVAVLLLAVFGTLAIINPTPLAPPLVFGALAINLQVAALTTLSAGLVSGFVSWLIVQSTHLHGHLSHDHSNAGPQKMHDTPTPRIGGLAVFSGLVISAVALVILNAKFSPLFSLNTTYYQLVLVSALPAFIGGLSEDLTKRVVPLDRLILTMAAGAFAAWLLGAVLTRLDIPVLDALLRGTPWLAILFTAFAVAGIANAINIIDGFNGLSSGYVIIVLAALAGAGFLVNDNLVLQLSLALAGALVGFLFWNWPTGKLFLGDGGAYLIGFLLAEIAVLLVMRNPEVSAWFPLVLMIHPVAETLYSVYRRKTVGKANPGAPDNRHLHHLIHARIVHLHTNHPQLRADKRTNPKVAKYLWNANLIIALSALAFWQSTAVLIGLALIYMGIYIVVYQRLARRQAQH